MNKLSPTAALEKELIDCVKSHFVGEIKTVEALGGAWTDETMRTLLKVAPAVYVAFIGNSPSDLRNCVRQTWALFVSVNVLNGVRIEPEKAFLIHDYLIKLLNNRQFNCAARAMQFSQSANLFSDLSAKRGLFVYGLYFTIDMPLPADEQHTIDDFITYYHKFLTTPIWESINTLPQDKDNNND
jgi:phage gp37-like protein